jgi:hypothetical protein
MLIFYSYMTIGWQINLDSGVLSRGRTELHREKHDHQCGFV